MTDYVLATEWRVSYETAEPFTYALITGDSLDLTEEKWRTTILKVYKVKGGVSYHPEHHGKSFVGESGKDARRIAQEYAREHGLLKEPSRAR